MLLNDVHAAALNYSEVQSAYRSLKEDRGRFAAERRAVGRYLESLTLYHLNAALKNPRVTWDQVAEALAVDHSSLPYLRGRLKNTAIVPSTEGHAAVVADALLTEIEVGRYSRVVLELLPDYYEPYAATSDAHLEKAKVFWDIRRRVGAEATLKQYKLEKFPARERLVTQIVRARRRGYSLREIAEAMNVPNPGIAPTAATVQRLTDNVKKGQR